MRILLLHHVDNPNLYAGSVWIIGPAVGGWLATNYGYTNSFVIAGVGAALCSLGYTQLPETLVSKLEKVEKEKEKEKEASRTWRESFDAWLVEMEPIYKDKNQQSLIALALIPSLRWSCFTSVVALHATHTIGAGPQEIGFMFSTLALSQGLGMPLGAWMADSKSFGSGDKKMLVLPPGFVSAASFGCISMATSLEHFLAAMAFQGLAAAFTQPAVGAFTAEVTPAEKRGQAMSLQRQASSMVGLLGPVSFGMIADTVGCPAAIMLSSGLMAGCNAVYMMRARAVTK